MSSLWKLFIFPCLKVALELIYITNEFYRLTREFKFFFPYQLEFQYLEKQTFRFLLLSGKKM